MKKMIAALMTSAFVLTGVVAMADTAPAAKPAAKKPAMAMKKPAAKKPAMAMKKPAAKKPAMAMKKPAAKKPAAMKPAPKKS
jgi:hypothetical protein